MKIYTYYVELKNGRSATVRVQAPSEEDARESLKETISDLKELSLINEE